MTRRICGTAAIALALVGCGRGHPPAARSASPALASATVGAAVVPIERELDGVIEAVEQSTVSAQTSGRVAALPYDVDDFVPAGAVLVRLRSAEQRAGLAAAQAAVSEAAARQTQAQDRYRRIADLYQHKVVPKAQLDEATADLDSALARMRAAQATLDSAREGVAYTEVRAPYPEVIAKRLVQEGETVVPGTPLISGLSLESLRVAVDVPQSIVDQLRRLKRAAVYIGERRIEATKVTLFPEATSPSNTFRARLDLPRDATDLYPGMFVKAAFVIGEADELLVPVGSVVTRSEVTAVYVLEPDGRPSLRQVRLGNQIGERVEVLAGLVAGDRVVVDPLAAMRQLALSVGSGAGS